MLYIRQRMGKCAYTVYMSRTFKGAYILGANTCYTSATNVRTIECANAGRPSRTERRRARLDMSHSRYRGLGLMPLPVILWHQIRLIIFSYGRGNCRLLRQEKLPFVSNDYLLCGYPLYSIYIAQDMDRIAGIAVIISTIYAAV